MSDDGDMDEAMEALEKHLSLDDANVFDSIEPCMDLADFVGQLRENKTKLVGLTGTELSDAEAERLVALIVKATALEGISLDGAETSTKGLALIIAAVNKHGKIKHLDLSGQTLDDQIMKILGPYLERTKTLESLNLSFCDVKPTAAKTLMEYIEKNASLISIQPPTYDDDAVLKFVEGVISRNKRNAAPQKATSASQDAPKATETSAVRPIQTSTSAVSSAPGTALQSTSKPLTVWVKGQIHIGEVPPSNEGWIQLTFDVGTTLTSVNRPDQQPTPSQGQKQTPDSASHPPPALTTSTPKAVVSEAPKRAQAPAPPAAPPAASAIKAPPPYTAVAASGPIAKKRSGPTPKFRCQALYSYTAQDEDEASFKKGDFLEIYKEIDEDWYVGKVESTGASGQVPSNHLKIVEKYA